MKTLSAKVLDPKHLELSEPLPKAAGDLIRISIADLASDPSFADDGQEAASDQDIELLAVQDTSEDFLSQEELSYYLGLEEL